MRFNENQIATYLFCAQLSNAQKPPLTIIEWNTLISALKQQNLEPKNLMEMTPSDVISILADAQQAQKIRIMKKIEARQQLGLSMIELEELTNQGYQLMFRRDMPNRLKKMAQKDLPPFFYCIGDVEIFMYPALSVVGARDANEQELTATMHTGKEAAMCGVVIVSGGARGVDTTAVNACLENGGKAIVFPADGLQSWVKKKDIRQYIQNGQLLLMSAQKVDARFTGPYAMQRNKYIHTAGQAVLVASSKISTKEKSSGTWQGVIDNIKAQWTPIFTLGESEGVKNLIENGHAQRFESVGIHYKRENVSMAQPSVEKKHQTEVVSFPQEALLHYLQSAKGSGMTEHQVWQQIEVVIRQAFAQTQKQETMDDSAEILNNLR